MTSSQSPLQKSLLPPLLARDRHEPHRSATQLELLFDLIVVIAIAAADHGLAHEIATNHIGLGIIKYLMAFFAIWWPWNLFTWFASSFDNDDTLYRLNVMVMMVGVLLVAAVVPILFAGEDTSYGFIGYVIFRLAAAVSWLRVKDGNPELMKTAHRYAWGQIAVQALWAINLFLLTPWSSAFLLMVAFTIACELFIPWYAERAASTPWHRHHIIERFGLLNIIVLGEIFLSSTHAIEASIHEGFNGPLVGLAGCGMVLAFAMWWFYFCGENHLESIEVQRSFVWSYGHFIVFASGAAVGAGLELMVEALEGNHLEGNYLEAAGHVAVGTAGLAISLPLALYILGLWLVRDRYQLKPSHASALLFAAVLIAFSGFLPHSPLPTMMLFVACLILRLRSESHVMA